MPIILQGFAGEIPKTEPRYLPDRNAARARNLHLDRQHIAPLHQPKTWATLPSARSTIYLHKGSWLSWPQAGVKVVPGPVAQDRLYITRPTQEPLIRVGATEYPLALPTPTSKPGLALLGTLDTDLQEAVIYTRTWVTAFDEESPPGPLSAPIDWSPGCSVKLTNIGAPPSGRSINRQRIYRSQTDASGATALFFVAEIDATDVTYIHDLAAAPIQEAIGSADFDAPPSGMSGLTAMPNGMMAAFLGKELLFSEPYQPHAWPVKYRLAVNDSIVGLAAFGNSLAVMTTGTPWVAQGLHPQQMSLERMEQPYPCASAEGIADLGYAAIYPSPDGLVQVSKQGAELISAPLWTREQWRALGPASMVATAWAGKYLFVATVDGIRKTAILDLSGAEPGVTWADLSAHSMVTDLGTGRLFMLLEDRVTVAEFDAADQPAMTATWVSRPFALSRPASFGAILVDASDASAGDLIKVYADSALKAAISTFNAVARLPPGKHRLWQIEVSGGATVTRIALGEVPSEVMT